MPSGESRQSGETVFAAVLALAGVAVVIASLNYGLTSEGRPGTGLVPFIAGLALALTAGWVAVSVHRGRLKPLTEEIVDDPELEEIPDEEGTLRRSATLFGLLGLMIVVNLWTGLLVAAIGFVLATGFFVERLSVRATLTLAGVAGLMIWVIFVWLLDVPILPGAE